MSMDLAECPNASEKGSNPERSDWYISTNFYGADDTAHWGLMVRKERPADEYNTDAQTGTLHNFAQAPGEPDGALQYRRDKLTTEDQTLYGGVIHRRMNEATARKVEEDIAAFDTQADYPDDGDYRCAPWVFDAVEHLEKYDLLPSEISRFMRTQRRTAPETIKENVRLWGKGEWFDGPLAQNQGRRPDGFEADARFEERNSYRPANVGRLDPARFEEFNR